MNPLLPDEERWLRWTGDPHTPPGETDLYGECQALARELNVGFRLVSCAGWPAFELTVRGQKASVLTPSACLDDLERMKRGG